MSGKKLLSIKPEFVLREEKGGSFVFDSSCGRVKGLNHVASEIWRLCDGTRTKDEIIAAVSAKYTGQTYSVSEIEKDVCEFIDILNKKGCLEEPSA
jgi:hypothetical protein